MFNRVVVSINFGGLSPHNPLASIRACLFLSWRDVRDYLSSGSVVGTCGNSSSTDSGWPNNFFFSSSVPTIVNDDITSESGDVSLLLAECTASGDLFDRKNGTRKNKKIVESRFNVRSSDGTKYLPTQMRRH